MKKLICIITLFSALAVSAGLKASAQESADETKLQYKDSIIYRPASVVDSELKGKDILNIMPSKKNGDKADVNIYQSADVSSSLNAHIASNRTRTISGYRVRIFFDNRQTARLESEETLKKFRNLYAGIAAYRTYANPYFKVTVGDFRTKTEAMALLERIKTEFPSAFVIKENITFPVVDKNNAFVTDTVKVMRPVQSSL